MSAFQKDMVTLVGLLVFFGFMVLACVWTATQEDAVNNERRKQRLKDQKRKERNNAA